MKPVPWVPEQASRLREAVRRLGHPDLSRAAEALGVHRSCLSRSCNGLQPPGPGLMLALAKKGVCLTWLLTGRSPTLRPTAVLFQTDH